MRYYSLVYDAYSIHVYKLMTGILQEILTYINVYICEVAMPSSPLLIFLFVPLE